MEFSSNKGPITWCAASRA